MPDDTTTIFPQRESTPSLRGVVRTSRGFLTARCHHPWQWKSSHDRHFEDRSPETVKLKVDDPVTKYIPDGAGSFKRVVGPSGACSSLLVRLDAPYRADAAVAATERLGP